MGVEYKAQQFMGTAEIGARLGGLTRQRVYQLTSEPNFPAPVADLGQGRVWLTSDVETWIAEHRKQKN
ncbi:AlpA family phage regulatory protein [Actinoplanes sp. NPDC023936]|uniref:helix-turn-helix transcriptional regulator n=1 Tax=Actinoplanes sp. NPDC023936 TaxID=3154910 RepID=UPI0033C7A78F